MQRFAQNETKPTITAITTQLSLVKEKFYFALIRSILHY